MRYLVILPMLVLAACGGGGTEEKKTTTRAAALAAGQWELTSQVTAFRTVDQGAAAIDTPVGTRTTESVCIAEGRPPAALFAGEGFDCRYESDYVRNGRVNVTLQCSREGLAGSILMTIDGQFQDGTLEYDRQLRTILSGDGDVEATVHVTGRRTGECTPEPEGGNTSNAQAG